MSATIPPFPARPVTPWLARQTGSASFWFYALCLIHASVWVLLPLLTYHSPPKDALEGVAWGYMWQFGYDKHPFLAPWLSALFVDLCGSVGGGIFLASQCAVLLAFWGVWRLGREMLGAWEALFAVLVLEGVYYYNLASITFNPNVISLPCWSIATWAFYRALKRARGRDWLLAGLTAGLAVLAKYEVAVLFAVMSGLLVSTPEGRRALRTPAFYGGIGAAILVVAPNLLWLIHHDFLPFHYTLEDMALEQGSYAPSVRNGGDGVYAPLLFFVEQCAALLPALALMWYALRRGDRGQASLPAFERRFLWAMACGPLLLTVLIGVASGGAMVARWAFPFFGVLGLAVPGLGRRVIVPQQVARAGRFAAVLNLILVAGVAWSVYVQPRLSGRPPYSIADPTPELSADVEALWHRHFAQALPVVAGDRWMIAGIDAYAPDRPKPYFDCLSRENPWLDDATIRRQGGVFIHRLDAQESVADVLSALRQRFPHLPDGEIRHYARVSTARLPSLNVWMAVLPPTPESGLVARQPGVSPG